MDKKKCKYDAKYIDEFVNDCYGYPYLPTILPSVERIIAIGDLHGDYDLTIRSFMLAKLIDENNKWIGGKTIVVQVGDQIDRCRPIFNNCYEKKNDTYNDESSDIKIMEFFTNLHKEALKVGGSVFSLLGNHELLNILGKFDYVSYENIKLFESYKEDGQVFDSAISARKYAFSPGHKYAKFIACTRQSAIIIGSNIFIHAGIIFDMHKYLELKKQDDLYVINKIIRHWLLGKIKLMDNKILDKLINDSNKSFFWNRLLGKLPPNLLYNSDTSDKKCSACKYKFERILNILNVGQMIIGHTPQFFQNNLGINSTCNNKLWRIDIGASQEFNKFDMTYLVEKKKDRSREIQVLEILNDKIFKIIKEN